MPVSSRLPDITFRADGTIDIAARIVHLLGIARGDIIAVTDVYGQPHLQVLLKAERAVGRHRGRCYPVSAAGVGTYRLRHKALAQHFLNGRKVARFACGAPLYTASTTLIPIITHLHL